MAIEAARMLQHLAGLAEQGDRARSLVRLGRRRPSSTQTLPASRGRRTGGWSSAARQ
jgi:hypothetical protein